MNERPCPTLTLEQFESADIDPGGFSHEAHVYVAWLYVMRYPRAEAISRFDAALRRLVEKIGAQQKYNAMVTWLFLVLIADRASDAEDWQAFRTRNADLFDDFPRVAAA